MLRSALPPPDGGGGAVEPRITSSGASSSWRAGASISLELLEHQVRGGRAELVVRDPNGRERRLEAVDERHVVVADDRDVIGAAQAALLERVVAPEREQVVAGHDRGEVAPAVEQLAAAARALGFGEHLAEHDQAGVDLEPARAHRVDEPLVARPSGVQRLRAGEVGDPLMAEPGQVLDGQADALVVVAGDGRKRVAVDAPVDEHDLGARGPPRRRAASGRAGPWPR